jgi:hypothetical protein
MRTKRPDAHDKWRSENERRNVFQWEKNKCWPSLYLKFPGSDEYPGAVKEEEGISRRVTIRLIHISQTGI